MPDIVMPPISPPLSGEKKETALKTDNKPPELEQQRGSKTILPIVTALVFMVLLIAGVGMGVNYITRQNELLTSTPIPSPSVPTIGPQASVQLDVQYKSPFDEKTQYVNPFSEQKNPFDQL